MTRAVDDDAGDEAVFEPRVRVDDPDDLEDSDEMDEGPLNKLEDVSVVVDKLD
jgi:hypothetical protein